jgi:GNAT superfamily N-acetyltransferase
MKVPERFREGVTRYTPADRADLVRFQERHFGSGSLQTDAARFTWLFQANPLRPAEGPEFWVCRREGVVVGQQGGIPFALKAGQARLRASWAIELMVDPRWRLRGVGPALTEAHASANRIVAGLHISDAARRSYLRSGWFDVGIMPLYVRPLHARRAMRASPLAGRWSRVAVAAGPLLAVADSVFLGPAVASGARLEPVERFDERADEVWRAAGRSYQVIAERDLSFLSWRFDEAPDRTAYGRYYLVRRSRAVGYVVLRRERYGGDPVTVLVDYLAEPRWLLPLFAWTTTLARREGAIALVCKTLNHPAGRVLRSMAFVRLGGGPGGPTRLMVRAPDDEDRLALLSDPRHWFLSAADSDRGHAWLGG